MARACEDYGYRRQLSVFLCRLSATDFVRLRNRLYDEIKLDEDQAAGAPSDASGSVGVASSHHGPGANVSGHKDPTAVDPDSKSPHWKPPHGRVIRDQHPFLDQIKQDKKETKGSLECVFLNYSNTLETAERLIRGYVNQVISCVCTVADSIIVV